MTIFLSLAVSLLLTLILELLFAAIWRVPREDLLLVVLVNVLTNPVVVLSHTLIAIYAPSILVPATVLLELAAFLTEGWFYTTRSRIPHPVLFSLCANLFSFLTGLVLF